MAQRKEGPRELEKERRRIDCRKNSTGVFGRFLL